MNIGMEVDCRRVCPDKSRVKRLKEEVESSGGQGILQYFIGPSVLAFLLVVSVHSQIPDTYNSLCTACSSMMVRN